MATDLVMVLATDLVMVLVVVLVMALVVALGRETRAHPAAVQAVQGILLAVAQAVALVTVVAPVALADLAGQVIPTRSSGQGGTALPVTSCRAAC